MTKHYFGDTHGGSSHDWKKPKKRCHTTHKPLKFGKGTLFGGSCSSPRKGYDIYIGLDYSMKWEHQKFPWEKNGVDDIIETQYRITDGCAPGAPAQFKKMCAWICVQLKDGKKVHVGCIGGHGRTGLVIAAVKSLMDGEKDATTWTRKHHCEKAVESKTQVNFLHKHFGIKKVKGSKADLFTEHKGTQTGRLSGKIQHKSNVVHLNKITPMAGNGSIWG